MPLPAGGEAEWIQSLIMLGLLAFLAAMMIRQLAESRRPEPERRVVTVEDCGGRRVERPFEQGDYVGKRTGTCDDGSPRLVVAIYAKPAEPAEGRSRAPGGPH